MYPVTVPDHPNLKSSKAQQASVLVRQIEQARGLQQKRAFLPTLNALFPDIVCRIDDDGRLRVYFLAERMQRVPKSLNFAAFRVEAVQPDGSSRVIKDKTGHGRPGQLLLTADVELEAFPHYRFELPPPRSVWERILDDDD